MDGLLTSNFGKARSLLKEAGYAGTPVVFLHSTDLYTLTNLGPVAKQLMEKAGFTVDMQSMDWQTVVARRAKKDAPSSRGWNAFLTGNAALDVTDPVIAQWLNASCDKALPGWPCDSQIENLRYQYARESDPEKRKAIADVVQVRVTEWTTHIHLGEYVIPAAIRTNLSGMLATGIPVFWNIEKK
jgi:peptide/nickel transport system substrate-binding protein